MKAEKEIRYSLKDAAEVENLRRTLQELNFSVKKAVAPRTVTFYDTFTGELHRSHAYARVTHRPDGSCTLTMKEKDQGGNGVKRRMEYEVEISNFKDFEHMLSRFGLVQMGGYEIVREVWEKKDVSVTIDHTKAGFYAEIEADFESVIGATAYHLGIHDNPRQPASYYELLRETRK